MVVFLKWEQKRKFFQNYYIKVTVNALKEGKMDNIEKNLLKEVADIEKVPMGAYNIRENGKGIERNVTENINIVTKKDKPGIDIIIKEKLYVKQL